MLVVGATGALGRSVVDSALANGHEVTALARNPESAGLPAGVQVIKGDVLDAASIEPAVQGCNAVICALGTPSPRKPTTLLEWGTANLIAAMTGTGVTRLVCVTLLGVGRSRPNTALLYRHVILRVLAPMVPDKENQEQVVRNSGLAWVLVRPPTIIGLGSGPARVIREGERGRIGLVSRTSLADLLVHAAGTDEYTHLAIAVGR